ncbi:CRISPR system precrRNA processing endoribonuclease RAMP protein Cas6 [Pseudoalteromonas peptidolytica]|uniref:CRISPR system precrRNA processing endoribonuclease RAMP protein Cas6 n=1 Tax=Pseudoalteromonas peptidolytica TaxID=61150 RepID=UPI00298EB957|nr:CRISPR system precrRNA processing endoribonuclease RAMP protein Cas6 [Pseudoalteromonas peptidolytica]MDW7548210.1 CRISPR system precrRNA processing endoribonuclease RAMP protein Cas6 [Pseudoalteromonas peptidolytica]
MLGTLLTLTQHFPVLRLRFTLQLQAQAQLPDFKGSMFHGWIGQAIKQHDEKLFYILCAEHEGGQPKPYAIKLTDEHQQQWQKGELLSFDLMLFGEAVHLSQRVIDALSEGVRLGIGEYTSQGRSPVKLLSVASVLPGRILPGVVTTVLQDWINTELTDGQCELALHLKAPLRLKHKGAISADFLPELYELNRHICRRLSQLTKFWVADEPTLLNALYTAQPRLGEYQAQHHCYFENWQRFSLKQRAKQPFGGLKGMLSFYGDIAPAKPWLQIGQVLSVGGKTTFGLGHYELIG